MAGMAIPGADGASGRTARAVTCDIFPCADASVAKSGASACVAKSGASACAATGFPRRANGADVTGLELANRNQLTSPVAGQAHVRLLPAGRRLAMLQ